MKGLAGMAVANVCFDCPKVVALNRLVLSPAVQESRLIFTEGGISLWQYDEDILGPLHPAYLIVLIYITAYLTTRL